MDALKILLTVNVLALLGALVVVIDAGHACDRRVESVRLKCGVPEGIAYAGMYYPNEQVYCVVVEGLSEEEAVSADPYLNEMQYTAVHELAHYLIDEDREHFCGQRGGQIEAENR